jgi:hypothetical protein
VLENGHVILGHVAGRTGGSLGRLLSKSSRSSIHILESNLAKSFDDQAFRAQIGTPYRRLSEDEG